MLLCSEAPLTFPKHRISDFEYLLAVLARKMGRQALGRRGLCPMTAVDLALTSRKMPKLPP
jgi:hypothetical protein